MNAQNINQQSEQLGFDIEAREAQVLGKPQRIAPLEPEDFDAEAKQLVISIWASLGYFGEAKVSEIFCTMLKHPGLYRRQMDMSIELLGNGTIPPRERELAVLRVAWLCRAPYEWGQHVTVAKRFDVTSEDIERVTKGSSAPGWNEHEAAIQRGVEELFSDQMIPDTTWSVLAKSWNERQLMEFPTLVGQYVAIAYSQNSLRLRLDEGNTGLRQR